MPITIHPFLESPASVFTRLQADNRALNNENLDKTFGDGLTIFDIGKPVEQLFKEGPINFGGIEWDFEWHYGLRSLVRRGFYKITGEPFIKKIPNLRTGEDIPTWGAEVLFCPHIDFEVYFKFLANVGPMVNNNAIGFNLTGKGPQIISSGNLQYTKDIFFTEMKNKTFYVTQQLYVDTYYKQTVWFKIE